MVMTFKSQLRLTSKADTLAVVTYCCGNYTHLNSCSAENKNMQVGGFASRERRWPEQGKATTLKTDMASYQKKALMRSKKTRIGQSVSASNMVSKQMHSMEPCQCNKKFYVQTVHALNQYMENSRECEAIL